VCSTPIARRYTARLGMYSWLIPSHDRSTPSVSYTGSTRDCFASAGAGIRPGQWWETEQVVDELPGAERNKLRNQ
jgi:S-adenosylmethionine hydrolase